MLMRLSFFIFFIFLLDFYLFSGITPVFNKSNLYNKIFNFLYWTISFLIYCIIVYIFLNYGKRTPFVHFNNDIIISSLILIVFMSKFFALIPLIIDDILRIFRFLFKVFAVSNINNSGYHISRIDFLQKTSLLLGSAFFLTLLAGMKFGRYNFKLKHVNINIQDWSKKIKGFKVIQISDLHLGGFNSIEKLEEVVRLINDQKPDLFVFTGDLVNNYYNEAIPYVETLKKIHAKYGKYSILGNHDYCDYVGWKRSSEKWKINFKNMIAIHKEIGFDLLLDESREININGSIFNLVGVENWGAGNFNKDGNLNKAMKLVDNNFPTILLSHDPSHWTAQVINFSKRIDLQLAGHTHGMQFGIDIPGIKWSPLKWRYKQWLGLYEEDSKYIYVNAGIGHLAYAGRVGIMPEISVLTIS